MSFATCNHVKEDGVYCASPALRHRKYCYYHLMHRGRRLRLAQAQGRNESAPLIIPPLESLGSMRVALSEIAQALGAGQLNHRTAGLMLYAIQQATTVSLRMAEIEAAALKDAGESTVAADAHGIEEYPDFEREFGLEPGVDLDAETDYAMRRAEEQVAVLSVVPTAEPDAGCPVPAKLRYTREEAYQLMQWQIHRMRKQIREYDEEKKREYNKKLAASVTAAPKPAASTA